MNTHTPRAQWHPTVRPVGFYPKDDRKLYTHGWPRNVNSLLLAGSKVTIQTVMDDDETPQVLTLREDLDTDHIGQGVLEFTEQLKSSAPFNAAISVIYNKAGEIGRPTVEEIYQRARATVLADLATESSLSSVTPKGSLDLKVPPSPKASTPTHPAYNWQEPCKPTCYAIDDGEVFDSVDEVVEHYRENSGIPEDEWPTILEVQGYKPMRIAQRHFTEVFDHLMTIINMEYGDPESPPVTPPVIKHAFDTFTEIFEAHYPMWSVEPTGDPILVPLRIPASYDR